MTKVYLFSLPFKEEYLGPCFLNQTDLRTSSKIAELKGIIFPSFFRAKFTYIWLYSFYLHCLVAIASIQYKNFAERW